MSDTILAIDDEPTQLGVFVDLLAAFLPEVDVVISTSGEDGLRQARKNPPDVILLDAKLPVMDGFEVCRRLKADPATRYIPLLMVSGKLTESEHRVRALEIGADGYLCKPFEPEELIAQVKSLLRIKHDEDELREKEVQLSRMLEEQTDSLRETEIRFQNMADEAPVLIWITNEKGEILYHNRRLRLFTGEDDSARLSSHFLEAIHPDEREQCVAAILENHQTATGFDIELRVKKYTGEYRWLLCNYTVRRSPAGKYLGQIASGIDITERRHTEAALRRLASAVDQSAEAVVITDTQGVIEYVNPGFEKMTGYTSKEALGQPVKMLKSERHDTAFYKELWETLLAGETWASRFVNLRKDGQPLEVEQTISPVRNSAGKIINFVSVSTDLTRVIQLENEFRQAQKLESIGLLAGGIAHDFNNILTSILGCGELILSDPSAPDGVREDAKEIVSGAERAATLTRQLLTFGRRHRVYMAPLNMNKVVRSMESLLQRTLREDIDLVTILEQSLWQTNADMSLLEQVVTNLAVNARDAMPDGGKLTVRTENRTITKETSKRHANLSAGEYVVLSVSDTGDGINPEIIQQIFDPFFTTKARGRGTGLGLSTVYGIVKQTNGTILVDSSEGAGTTFTIFLPRAADAPEQPVPAALKEAPRGSETILVVEDEERVRKLARRSLETLGYSVIEACNGEEGLQIALENAEEINLVLSDVVMPQMNGPEMVKQIHAKKPSVRILFMSGFPESGAFDNLDDMEKEAVMAKPFSQLGLAINIREQLDTQ